MSIAESVSREGGSLLFLLPEEINWTDETNVRPGVMEAGEEEAIKGLAESIKREGQIQPILVRSVFDGDEGEGKVVFVGVVGRRRTAAISLINAEKTSKEEPLRVKAVAEKVDDPFRTAIMENLKRRDMNPLDMARNIGTIREKYGWKGAKGTRKVADYLGVSPAYVTTHEGLLGLPEETLVKIQSGEIKRDYAFELLNVQPEQRPVVEATAAQLAEEEETETAAKTGRAKKKATPTAKHVRSASRQHAAAIAVRPLSRTEIIDWFNKLQSPKWGFENGEIHRFSRSFMQWVEGKVRDETFEKYFALMVNSADRGTEDKSKEPVVDEVKKDKKKAKGKSKPAPKK